jgi:hypothetical protein
MASAPDEGYYEGEGYDEGSEETQALGADEAVESVSGSTTG